MRLAVLLHNPIDLNAEFRAAREYDEGGGYDDLQGFDAGEFVDHKDCWEVISHFFLDKGLGMDKSFGTALCGDSMNVCAFAMLGPFARIYIVPLTAVQCVSSWTRSTTSS